MVFDFEAFVEEPSLEELNKCKKKDLIALAVHFNILYSKQSRKDEIRALLVDGLVELGLLSQPVASEGTDESIVPAGTPKREEKPGPSDGSPPGTKRAGAGVDEPPNPLFTLPRYDPHSPPTSPRSLDAARRAVRLARIKMEAEQKERDRSAELEFQVRKLEIEADKDVKLRRLELEAEGRLPPSPTPGPGPTAQAAAHSPSVHGGALDGDTLSAKYTGPYVVKEKLSDTDYIISTPDRRRKTRVCHINMLKQYHSRVTPTTTEPSLQSVSALIVADQAAESGLKMRKEHSPRLPNSEMLTVLPAQLKHLSADQQADVLAVVGRFRSPANAQIVHSGAACNVKDDNISERIYTIKEGDTLVLQCIVKGHPRPQVRWTKTAGSASDKFQETSIYNETLRIESIQRVQGGRYYCKADNGVGVAAIKSIRVDVQYTRKPPQNHTPCPPAQAKQLQSHFCIVKTGQTLTWHYDHRDSGSVS
uniref:Ig-like domain-containing protein n=1 Tax=Knipowitschia caucasica TaxID=637954 RepID=A0AAV2LQ90_KNICA